MFEQSRRTPFGPTLTVCPTTLCYLPQANGRGLAHSDQALQVPTLQLNVPPPMLDLARSLDGGSVRLGCLSADQARIGVAMVYLPGHFAATMFDHGDDRSREIADAALSAGHMTVLLRDESGSVAVKVRVTDLMRRVLTDCKSTPPATFAQFVECSQGLARLLADPQTFVEMGVDPKSLQTITLSVCAPTVEAEVSVDIVHAKRQA